MKSKRFLFRRAAAAAALASVLVVGGACRDERPLPPAAATTPAPDAAAATDVPPATTVDTVAEIAPASVTPVRKESSSVGFTGRKVTGYHDGKFTQFDGRIEYNDYEPGRVMFAIDTASVTTGIDRLDNHLRSPDFFDSAKYPTATFASTAISPDVEKWESGTYRLTGILDLHGVRKTTEFPAKVTVSPNELRAQAEFTINRQEWNIAYKGKADDLIRDDVVIRLDLRFPPPPKQPPPQ